MLSLFGPGIIATLLVVLVLVGANLFKKPNTPSFQNGSG